jgi:hypothetical protein
MPISSCSFVVPDREMRMMWRRFAKRWRFRSDPRGSELDENCDCGPQKLLCLAKTRITFEINKMQRGCVTCPIKGNVKRKNLPVGPMPTFFSRHSAHPFERPLLLPRVVLLGPKVQLRFRVRSGETLLPCGSIFATVTAPFVS